MRIPFPLLALPFVIGSLGSIVFSPSTALASCAGATVSSEGSCIVGGACNPTEKNIGPCTLPDSGNIGACCVIMNKSDSCTVPNISTPGTCKKDGCGEGETAWGSCTDASDRNGQCCFTKTVTDCTAKGIGGADVQGTCEKSCGKGYKSAGACTGGVCCISDSTQTGYFNPYGYTPPLGSATIPQIIARFISQVLPLIGSLFFLMFLWGGFQWFTAGGDEKKVAGARSTLLNAIIGISIIIFAYAIVSWLISVFAAGLKK